MIIENTALLFDLDGTLIDSSGKVPLDVQAAFARLGTLISIEEARASRNWEETAARYGYTKEMFRQSFNEAREPWTESLKKGNAKIYDDTIPTLDEITGLGYRNLALVTRSDRAETDVKIDHFGLRRYFSYIGVTPPRKSEFPTKEREARDAINYFLRNGFLSRAIIIGDSEPDDIGTANILKASPPGYDGGGCGESCKPIGIKSVYVNRNGKSLETQTADYSIQNLRQLMEILEHERRSD